MCGQNVVIMWSIVVNYVVVEDSCWPAVLAMLRGVANYGTTSVALAKLSWWMAIQVCE
jgi:hypothetical protein